MFCPPLWWCCVQGACTDTLFLLPALQKWQLGFFFGLFCILLSRICPNYTCMWLFLVPYSFFVFCSLRRHLSRCKHCSRGSQVPGPSLSQKHHLFYLPKGKVSIQLRNHLSSLNSIIKPILQLTSEPALAPPEIELHFQSSPEANQPTHWALTALLSSSLLPQV